MSRLRSIKPSFWSSEQVMSLSRDARLLFIGIWNFSDDEGVFKIALMQLKAQVFPGDEDVTRDMMAKWVGEVIHSGLAIAYSNGPDLYGFVTGWEHQRIDKPQKAKYPSLQDNLSIPRTFQEYSTNVLGTFPPDRIGEDRKGREGSGGEPPGASAPILAESATPERADPPAQAALALDAPKAPAKPATPPKPKSEKPTKTGALVALKAALSAEMAKLQDVAPALSESQGRKVAQRVSEFAQANGCTLDAAAGMLAASWVAQGSGNVWKLCDVPFRQNNAARASPMQQRDQRENTDGQLADLRAELLRLEGKHALLFRHEDKAKREAVELEMAGVKAEMRDLKGRR